MYIKVVHFFKSVSFCRCLPKPNPTTSIDTAHLWINEIKLNTRQLFSNIFWPLRSIIMAFEIWNCKKTVAIGSYFNKIIKQNPKKWIKLKCIKKLKPNIKKKVSFYSPIFYIHELDQFLSFTFIWLVDKIQDRTIEIHSIFHLPNNIFGGF